VLVGVGRRFEVGGTGELQAGAMLGHGRARNDSRSQVTGYTARGVVTGTSVGAYATWLQDARMEGGAYVDGWLQYGRFRNSVQGEGLQKERYDARNWSASAEAGYVLPCGAPRSAASTWNRSCRWCTAAMTATAWSRPTARWSRTAVVARPAPASACACTAVG
jgi:outer membrane autotransporter protein